MKSNLTQQQVEVILGMIAHEVRSPLQAILTSTYLLNHCQDRNSISEISERIKRQTTFLDQMFKCLYLFTGIKQSKLDTKKEVVCIAEIIRTAIEMNEQFATNKEIILDQTELSVNIIECFPALLIESISNIIFNSIKFSPQRSRIQIKTNEKKGSIAISVKDEGIGISNQQLEKVFDLFNQEKSEFNNGLGMGLYISKLFINLHDGKISAKSNGHNKGSEFIIEIPSTIKSHDHTITRSHDHTITRSHDHTITRSHDIRN